MPPAPPPPAITITVETSFEIFYRCHFWRLEDNLMKKIPDAQMAIEIGRSDAYEVTVNGILVYSKLKRGRFPKEQEIVKYCEMVVKDGRDPEEIPRLDYMFCVLS